MKKKLLKIGILVSGGGSNMRAIIDAVKSHKIPAEIAVVISNKSDAPALQKARQAGIPTIHLDPKNYPDRDAYTKAVTEELENRGTGLVCLAGFMCILTPRFAQAFPLRAMNIHPALLPAFGGTGMYGHFVHEAVIASGAKYSGCTVHFVDEGCDTGPIIAQLAVKVLDQDTPDTLAGRILKYEHRLYPQAVKLFAQGKLRVEGKRVKISGS